MEDKPRPKLLIFSSGTKDGGGSGFKELLRNAKTGVLQADIVGAVSNHEGGGVAAIASEFGVPFRHFNGPFAAESYADLVIDFQADFVALSGWLKLAAGLDPKTTINIHPGPLPRFGGKGMYGKHVHEAVVAAAKEGTATSSAVTMHFVTPKYDEGPVFFRYPVLVDPADDGPALGTRVNKAEHGWQSYVTNLVITGRISWDGHDPKSLVVPEGWPFLQHVE